MTALLLGSPAAMQWQPNLDPPDEDDYPCHADGTPLTWEELDAQNERDYADMVSAQEEWSCC